MHRRRDIEHLERLAHLDLTVEERALLADRLGRLLDWCAVLPPADGREAGVPVAGEDQELRDDVAAPSPGGTGLPPGDPREVDGFVVTPPPSGRYDDLA